MSLTNFVFSNKPNSRLSNILETAYYNGFLAIFALQSSTGTSFVDPQGRLMVATKDTVE